MEAFETLPPVSDLLKIYLDSKSPDRVPDVPVQYSLAPIRIAVRHAGL